MKSTDSDFPLMASNLFLEAMGGDPELCLSIIETALIEADEQSTRINDLSEQSDRDAARAVIHKLRGGSATFEAATICPLLQKMETACESEGIQSVLPFLPEFKIEAQRYQEALLCLAGEIRAEQ